MVNRQIIENLVLEEIQEEREKVISTEIPVDQLTVPPNFRRVSSEHNGTTFTLTFQHRSPAVAGRIVVRSNGPYAIVSATPNIFNQVKAYYLQYSP